jgi:hypothetical protein
LGVLKLSWVIYSTTNKKEKYKVANTPR